MDEGSSARWRRRQWSQGRQAPFIIARNSGTKTRRCSSKRSMSHNRPPIRVRSEIAQLQSQMQAMQAQQASAAAGVPAGRFRLDVPTDAASRHAGSWPSYRRTVRGCQGKTSGRLTAKSAHQPRYRPPGFGWGRALRDRQRLDEFQPPARPDAGRAKASRVDVGSCLRRLIGIGVLGESRGNSPGTMQHARGRGHHFSRSTRRTALLICRQMNGWPFRSESSDHSTIDGCKPFTCMFRQPSNGAGWARQYRRIVETPTLELHPGFPTRGLQVRVSR